MELFGSRNHSDSSSSVTDDRQSQKSHSITLSVDSNESNIIQHAQDTSNNQSHASFVPGPFPGVQSSKEFSKS